MLRRLRERWRAYVERPVCQATWVTLGSGTGMEQDDYVCTRDGCDVDRGVCMADRDHFASARLNQEAAS